MPRLNSENRNWILGLLDVGISQIENLGCSNVARMICRLAQHVRQTGTVADHPRPGQVRVTSQRQDNYMPELHLWDCFQTAAATASVIISNRGRQIHHRTVSRGLKEFGIPCRGPYLYRPILTRRHTQLRNNFAQTTNDTSTGMMSSSAMSCVSICTIMTDKCTCIYAVERDTPTNALWNMTGSPRRWHHGLGLHQQLL